jgi:multisubunit Na+/H+ antiporter MnhC subunit
MIKIQHLLMLLLAAVAYITYDLLLEEKQTVKKILLLMFLLGSAIVLLVYLTVRTIKDRISRLERWNFKRNYKQTLVTDFFEKEMDEEEYRLLN